MPDEIDLNEDEEASLEAAWETISATTEDDDGEEGPSRLRRKKPPTDEKSGVVQN